MSSATLNHFISTASDKSIQDGFAAILALRSIHNNPSADERAAKSIRAAELKLTIATFLQTYGTTIAPSVTTQDSITDDVTGNLLINASSTEPLTTSSSTQHTKRSYAPQSPMDHKAATTMRKQALLNKSTDKSTAIADAAQQETRQKQQLARLDQADANAKLQESKSSSAKQPSITESYSISSQQNSNSYVVNLQKIRSVQPRKEPMKPNASVKKNILNV
jgi:hypothetical protein